MTNISISSIAETLSSTLGPLGYLREPYSIGPTGVGVFKLPVSDSIAAYVSVVMYPKYRALGAGIGFGFDELKPLTDACLSELAARKGLSAMHTVANPCPAALFVLDCFVGPESARPIPLEPGYQEAVRVVIDQQALSNFRWVSSRSALCEFLMDGTPPFQWYVNVPRRLCHVAYLMSMLGVPLEAAKERFSKEKIVVSGDADFDDYPDDLVRDVLEYFYARSPDRARAELTI